MKQLKVGDKVVIKKQTGDFKGIITGVVQLKYTGTLEIKNKIGDTKDEKTIFADFLIRTTTGICCRINENFVFPIGKEKPKELIPLKTIGAEKEDCKILWNRLDDLNLEFSVEGRANVMTVLKVLLKHLDLEKFKYTRVCPYKVGHEYPRNNEEKNHIFSIKYVDFSGEIKTQEVIRTDRNLAIENSKFNVFIPDLLEIAKDRNIVTLEDDIYRVKENKLNGACNDYQPIREVNRTAFEYHGWRVPKSFENKFMKYKKF
ncbi:MAG: hypothetical protein ACRC1T_05180 [Clostridium chrysemydis]|uniref:hypothetical protein n=1 Tax=Clostridium chrysemydis TaxID=2665504 RepID=UPI003F3F728E